MKHQRKRTIERIEREASREIAAVIREAKRAERREWVQLLGERKADEVLAACDRARAANDLCRCPGGVDLRHHASQAEVEAARAEPRRFCGGCEKGFAIVFFNQEEDVIEVK